MKLNIIFSLAFLAIIIQQGESSALKSSIKDAIVKILETVNGIVGQVSNEANEYFLEKLQNYTGIKEWSVDIQVKVVAGLTEGAFNTFNAYKDYILSKDASETETKVLTCIANQEAGLLAAVKDAASQNGWCNNRLAGNLTVAFQDVTKNLIVASDKIEDDIKSLSSCWLGDDICLAAFAAKVIAVAQSELIPSGDTLLTGLEDVVRVYKIMFGQDVPRCNVEYLFPILSSGIQTTFKNLSDCINN